MVQWPWWSGGLALVMAMTACGGGAQNLEPAPVQEPNTPEPTAEDATIATAAADPSVAAADPSASLPTGRLLFDSDRSGRIDIWYLQAGSDEPVRVTTDPGVDRVSSWGPNGNSVIFSSDREPGPDSPSGLRAYALWVADLSGEAEDRHLLGTRTFNHGAVYSPDGSLIAFYSDPTGETQLYVMNADGSGQPTRLTHADEPASGPSWSPDGAEIAFSQSRAGNWDVYVMNADGSNVRQLTDDPATDWGVAWSPDGDRIAFYSDRSGDNEIYVMDVDGSNVVRLTEHPASDRSPSWSPDGEWIAFSTDRDGNGEIYVIRPDGSELTNVTNHPARDDFPSWGP